MKKVIILLFLVVSVVFGGAKSVAALTVAPAVIDVALDPGTAVTQEIVLFNEGKESVKVAGYIETFIPKGIQGEAEIMPGINYQAVSWVDLGSRDIILKPQETKKIPIVIRVPKTAQVGGYYLAIMWESGTKVLTTGSWVAITGRVGNLILLRVNGDLKEKIEIENFHGRDHRWFSCWPVPFSVTLKNSGNIHLKPSGNLLITNQFGRVADAVNFNSEQKNILPNSNRQFDLLWGQESRGGGFWSGLKCELAQRKIGRFQARLDLEYGTTIKQRISSVSWSFWLIPWRTILVIVILIIFLGLARIFTFKRKK